MAEIRFGLYALEQMRERGLSETVIREALANPEQVLAGKRDRLIAQRRIQERGKQYLLRVIYETSGEILTVVTGYKTSKIGKYWRQ